LVKLLIWLDPRLILVDDPDIFTNPEGLLPLLYIILLGLLFLGLCNTFTCSLADLLNIGSAVLDFAAHLSSHVEVKCDYSRIYSI
jgi:hypothetical protein